MRKEIILLMVLVLASSIVMAAEDTNQQDIIIDSQIKDVYNLGDKIPLTVKVKSASVYKGDINLDIVREKLTAKSVSGDVTFSDVTGVLDIRTTSGDQKGKKVMFTGESSFNAISGDIHVDYDNLEESLGFDLRSGSGDLSAGGVTADGSLKKAGGEYTIKGSTTSGDQTFL